MTIPSKDRASVGEAAVAFERAFSFADKVPLPACYRSLASARVLNGGIYITVITALLNACYSDLLQISRV